MQQGLRVAEQESVGLLVQLSHLFVNASQQSQLVEMLHGEIGTLIHLDQCWTMCLRKVEDWEENFRNVLIQIGIILYICFLYPVVRTVHALGKGGVYQVVITILAISQFVEITPDASGLATQVVCSVSSFFERIKEGSSNFIKLLFGLFSDAFHLLLEILKEAFFFHALRQLVGIIFVIVTEDMLTERLDLPDYVPAFVVGDVFLDVFHDPEEQFVGVFQTLDEFIHGLLLHLVVIESDAEVGSQIQLSCQVSQHALKEGVDGLHVEVVVVVDEQS